MKSILPFGAIALVALVGALPSLSACSDSSDGSGQNAPAATSGDASAPGAVAWKDMSKADRASFMKSVVMPKMQEELKAFDAEKFAKISCATCHGDGAKDGSFAMPNEKLPKLSTAGGFKKHMDKDPKLTKFMMEKVSPTMAQLLGEKPYDPKTGEGFGCFDCHTHEKE